MHLQVTIAVSRLRGNAAVGMTVAILVVASVTVPLGVRAVPCRLSIVMGTYLTGHPAELRHSKVAGNDAFPQSGVVLVLQVHEQRADLRLIARGRALVIRMHSLLDILRSAQNEFTRYHGAAVDESTATERINLDVRAPESNTRAS